MVEWRDEAIVLSRTNFSETSIVLKVFTRLYGVRKGFIKGGRSKKQKSNYETGNIVSVVWKSRSEDKLGNFYCELIKSNSGLFFDDSLRFNGIISSLNLIEFCLLENDSEKSLYEKTFILIENILHKGKKWLQNYVIWELNLLKYIGFGLELHRCALTNSTKNLKYVSPKTGRAVSEKAGKKWEKRLLPLPDFLNTDKKLEINEILNGLKLSSYFLEKFSNSIERKLPFTRQQFIDNILLIKK